VIVDATQRRTIAPEGSSGIPTRGELEKMARRRYQEPKPQKRGLWWTLRVYEDRFEGGQRSRIRKRIRLAPVTGSDGRPTPVRDMNRMANEYLRPVNQGTESIAVNFRHYVETTYIPVALPKMANTTQDRYRGVLDNYLLPAFGKLTLRELTPMAIDTYFATLADTKLSHASVDKLRDVLASVIKGAMQHRLILTNPMDGLELLPRAKKGKAVKPHITPEQFEDLLKLIPEPYATMLNVAVYTGLRVSEWDDVHPDAITIDERQERQQRRDHRSRSVGDRTHSPPEAAHRQGEGRSCDSAVQIGEGRRPRRPSVSVGEGRTSDARQQHTCPVHQARRA